MTSAEPLSARQRAAATKRERSKGRIIEAARLVIAEEGGWDFTLGDVARTAGVSNTTLFKIFPTKVWLILNVYSVDVAQVLIRVRGQILSDGEARPAEPEDRLMRYFSELVRTVEQHRNVIRATLMCQYEILAAHPSRDVAIDVFELVGRDSDLLGQIIDHVKPWPESLMVLRWFTTGVSSTIIERIVTGELTSDNVEELLRPVVRQLVALAVDTESGPM